MHPAYSVIAFTTLSGAGYGLLIWLCVFVALGVVAPTTGLVLLGFGVAFAMITGGLLSSTLHLGRPERAWRAFSQWRTSWLSREGVAAVATYVPSGLLALYWLVVQRVDDVALVLAIATIVCALVTVYCTGMIYASLRTIRQWHHPLVPWVFIVLALASGAVVFNLVLCAVQVSAAAAIGTGLVAIVLAVLVKLAYWSAVDGAAARYTAEDATGLGRFGAVRPLEPAHSRPNFVMREMGYEVGRRHSAGLRQLAVGAASLTIIFLLVAGASSSGALAVVASILAVLTAGIALGVERWLFFAEAQHVVKVFYRGGVA